MKLPGTKSVREAALVLETSDRRILDMIDAGELRPINTSPGKHRPRWAIPDDQIESLKKPVVETVIAKPKKQHV